MKDLNMSRLLDLYAGLLTDKQVRIVQEYFDNDLSLAEIALQEGTTRQAVRSHIVSACKSLNKYESKLGMCDKIGRLKQQLRLSVCDMAGSTIMQDIGEIVDIVDTVFFDES